MHLLLLAIGILVTAVGAVMLAFSVPLTDSAGVALFTSGMIAVVGGLILVGLSAVLVEDGDTDETNSGSGGSATN